MALNPASHYDTHMTKLAGPGQPPQQNGKVIRLLAEERDYPAFHKTTFLITKKMFVIWYTQYYLISRQ